MAPFFPVYVRRSDGKLSVQKNASLKAAKESNEPLPEQLVSKPNSQGISDYYRLCQPGHVKETDWRRKLGGMLIREIGPPDMQDKNYILSALPEHYRLYEHLRVKVSDPDPQDGRSKTHAGGGNERQDAYLYGYPQGRKKRYRSPAEFFPHLLWLATDEAGDPNNCTCRFCSPEEVELEGETTSKASRQVVKGETQSKVGVGVGSAPQPPGPKPVQHLSSGPQPSGLPRIRNYEQTLDLSYNKFLFRPGEAVWFQRGSAWGLGSIIQRSMLSLNPPKYQYRVQPLSHPHAHPQVALCTQEQIRNWLAWSPPPCISQVLVMRPHTFDNVNWRSYLDDPKLTSQDAEVDGSILAAKAVESTYTLFELVNSTSSTSSSAQVSEKYYNGIFLGAEKIWLGDALRVRGQNNATIGDVLVLQQILERLHPDDPSRSAVLFIGDVYTPASAPSVSAPKSAENLPVRMRSDFAIKNQWAANSPDPTKRGRTHFWRLVNANATLNFSDIKGRWYEASLLMPILSPTEYASEKQKGELSDAGLWMNGHGDCNKPLDKGPDGPPFVSAWIKVKKREEAFGRSVPGNFKIVVQDKEPKAIGHAPGALPASPAGGSASKLTQGQSQLGSTYGQTGQAQAQAQANTSKPRQTTVAGPAAQTQQQRQISQGQGHEQGQDRAYNSSQPQNQTQAPGHTQGQFQQQQHHQQQQLLFQRRQQQEREAQIRQYQTTQTQAQRDSVRTTQHLLEGYPSLESYQRPDPQGRWESPQKPFISATTTATTINTGTPLTTSTSHQQGPEATDGNFDEYMDFGDGGGPDIEMGGP